MKRVVITGCGIVSSLGNSLDVVTENLAQGRSGTRKVDLWEEMGLTSTVAGVIPDVESKIDAAGITRKQRKPMCPAALYAVLATHDAIAHSNVTPEERLSMQCGCFVGSGVGDVLTTREAVKHLSNGQPRRVNPYSVVRVMGSSGSANVVNMFPVGGRSYSIASACATGAHNIGHAYELIQAGILDMAFAGGSEDVNDISTAAFGAMRLALSTQYNDRPEIASRPYDKDRDGCVMSGGAGILVLESVEHAKARGASILAEIVGYAANSDGYNVLLPEPEGKMTSQCMSLAMSQAGIGPDQVDYLNTHGTATIAGDPAEIHAVRKVFGSDLPDLSSTKSMTGHPLGAAGAVELIFCLQMMRNGFMAPSINIDNLDPEFSDVPIVREKTDKELNTVMSNNFGFGGTNATTILKRWEE